MLIVTLILLFRIEDDMCYLYELYFDIEKLAIWIVWIAFCFFGKEFMIEELSQNQYVRGVANPLCNSSVVISICNMWVVDKIFSNEVADNIYNSCIVNVNYNWIIMINS